MIIINNIIITIRIIITIIKIIKFIIGHTAKSVTELNFSGRHVWRYISTIYYTVLQIPTLTSHFLHQKTWSLSSARRRQHGEQLECVQCCFFRRFQRRE